MELKLRNIVQIDAIRNKTIINAIIFIADSNGKFPMCFGVSNFAMRESAGIFDNVIDKSGGKFFKRFIEGVSLSPEGLICTGMF